MTDEPVQTPVISWDSGPAYDFFVSLLVLHQPDRFGLRGSWARGVRSRLPQEARTFLENTQKLLKIPLAWLYNLSQPKNTDAMLAALAALPVEERIARLTIVADMPPVLVDILREVAARKTWTEHDRRRIREAIQHKTPETEEEIGQALEWWAQPEKFGELVLQSFRVYQEVFFAEEEERIAPKLDQALAQAQALASQLALPDLVEELSQGIRFEKGLERPYLVMTPSFWISPLIILTHVDEQHDFLLFGGRPADASLVPGEFVPDSLFQPLKALADPTRLRILRYLAEAPMSPSELARRLRLRAPTVIHHLNMLRLAGLVHLTLDSKGDRRYAVRISRVQALSSQLNDYLRREG